MNLAIYYDIVDKKPVAQLTDCQTARAFARRDLENNPEQPVIDFIRLDEGNTDSEISAIEGFYRLISLTAEHEQLFSGLFLKAWLGYRSTQELEEMVADAHKKSASLSEMKARVATKK